jgi:hypothetical protein
MKSISQFFSRSIKKNEVPRFRIQRSTVKAFIRKKSDFLRVDCFVNLTRQAMHDYLSTKRCIFLFTSILRLDLENKNLAAGMSPGPLNL